MGVNETIFPSKQERKHFEHLRERWSTNYRLYSNLPFLTVLNVSKLVDATDWPNPKPFKVSTEDFNRLKKTSIDYTLCTLDDKPLVCIEFDGIHQGFNVGDKFIEPYKSSPWRKLITDLKLRIAHGSQFPFFVMGSSQFLVLYSKDKLAIADCVIGTVLAKAHMETRFDDGFDPIDAGLSNAEFKALTPKQQRRVFEEWAVGVEVDSMFKMNPLFKIMYELRERLKVTTMGYGPIENPELTGVSDPEKRAEIVKHEKIIGAQAWVELPTGSRVTGTVWVPNFETPGYSPYAFIFELATYVALKRAERKIRKHRTV